MAHQQRSRRTAVVVSIVDEHLGDLRPVVQELERAGMQVTQILDGVGVVSGLIADSKLRDLPKVQGVGNVETERTFEIAPPDSDVQ